MTTIYWIVVGVCTVIDLMMSCSFIVGVLGYYAGKRAARKEEALDVLGAASSYGDLCSKQRAAFSDWVRLSPSTPTLRPWRAWRYGWLWGRHEYLRMRLERQTREA